MVRGLALRDLSEDSVISERPSRMHALPEGFNSEVPIRE
jgi:hypothetical protein